MSFPVLDKSDFNIFNYASITGLLENSLHDAALEANLEALADTENAALQLLTSTGMLFSQSGGVKW